MTEQATRGVPRRVRLSLCAGVVLLASLAGSVDSARACTCGLNDPWLGIQGSDAAFVGRLLERRSSGGQIVLTFSVEQAAKGAIGDTVKALESSQCGFPVSVGMRMGVLLDRDGGRWLARPCGMTDPDDLLAAAAPLPAPDGEGAAATYVGGRFGAARLLALDAQGRTLAYATGPGTTKHVSVCPGGRRLAELAEKRRSSALAIRDARTLRLIRRQDVELPRRREPGGLLCENTSGTTVVLFGIGNQEPRRAALYRVATGRTTVIWRGTAYLSSLGPGAAYLNAGKRGAELVRVDLRTGGVRELARVPRLPRFVPDPTGRRLAGVAALVTRQLRLVLVELGPPVTVRWIPLRPQQRNGNVHWLSGRRLLFVPLRDADSARVLDLSLRTRSQFPFAAWDTARVGSTVFGVESEGGLESARLPGGPARVVRELPGGARPQVIVSASD